MIDKSNSKHSIKKKGIKSEIIDSSKSSGVFFLKKYEFVIMLLGAGVIFLLIIVVFLQSSGDRDFFNTKTNTESIGVKDFQHQIDRLENRVEKEGLGLKDNKNLEDTVGKAALNDFEKRIETSFSRKYETLASRINRLERSIDKLSRKIDSNQKINSKKAIKRPLVKNSKKKETKKKASIVHTVKKGDTLYNLSKQYSISVSQLEKINHLPKNANIYPGDNLLVK